MHKRPVPLSAASMSFPAISSELDFIVRHTSEADDIYDGIKMVDEDLKKLTITVYDRAETDVRDLLHCLQRAFDEAVTGLARVGWLRYRMWSWEIKGPIYPPRGPRKRIGSVGLSINSYDPVGPRVTGWVYPRGGVDGRLQVARRFHRKFGDVHLVSDARDQYGTWEVNDDAVIWFSKRISTATARDNLSRTLKGRAKEFFKIAVPTMKAIR